MRPGVTDTLAGVRRILDEIIAPELREGYPSQVLRGVVKNLAMLEESWDAVLPFLHWDNEETASLLAEAAPHVGGELAERIARVRDHQPDPLSVELLEDHNSDLRGLLAEAIPRLMVAPQAADTRRRVRDHLVQRMTRYPFRMAVAAPTKKHKS